MFVLYVAVFELEEKQQEQKTDDVLYLYIHDRSMLDILICEGMAGGNNGTKAK